MKLSIIALTLVVISLLIYIFFSMSTIEKNTKVSSPQQDQSYNNESEAEPSITEEKMLELESSVPEPSL